MLFDSIQTSTRTRTRTVAAVAAVTIMSSTKAAAAAAENAEYLAKAEVAEAVVAVTVIFQLMRQRMPRKWAVRLLLKGQQQKARTRARLKRTRLI